MIEALRKAFELAQQQSEAEQEVIAQLIFEVLEVGKTWDKLLTSPKSATLLEQLADKARKEHSVELTRDLDELL